MKEEKCEECSKEFKEGTGVSIFRKIEKGDFVEIESHVFCSMDCLIKFAPKIEK